MLMTYLGVAVASGNLSRIPVVCAIWFFKKHPFYVHPPPFV